MKTPLTPLVEQVPSSPEEAREAALLRANLHVPGFDAAAQERVRRRLVAGERSWLPMRWRLAALVGALAASPVATAAVLYYRPALRALFRPAAPAPERRPPTHPHLRNEAPSPVAEAAPAPAESQPTPPVRLDPAPEPAPRAHSTRPTRQGGPRAASVASAAREPPTPDIPKASVAGGLTPDVPSTALAQELAVFRQAVQALTVDRDGARALAALAAYRQQYPAGAFRQEAFVARVDALMLLGRSEDALHALEGVDPAELRRGPKGAELEVLKAELEKEGGSCARALGTFDRVLAAPQGPLWERALWGRAGCRAALEDAAGSRADLETYLRLFPSGAHAQKARAVLNGP